MEVSKNKNIIATWFKWHFLQMPGILVYTWKNYMVFILEFFSIPFLLATLLSPWRQYRWNYPRLLSSPGEWLGNFISNTFSRCLGFLLRVLLILVGISVELLVVVIGVTVILFWIFMPLVVAVLILFLFVI